MLTVNYGAVHIAYFSSRHFTRLSQTKFRKLLETHGQACDERCTYGIEAVRRNPFRVEYGLTNRPRVGAERANPGLWYVTPLA
jgi:hypothetical protein